MTPTAQGLFKRGPPGGLTDRKLEAGSDWPPTHSWSHQGWRGSHAAATSGWGGTALCMPARRCREAPHPPSLLVAQSLVLVKAASLFSKQVGACILGAWVDGRVTAARASLFSKHVGACILGAWVDGRVTAALAQRLGGGLGFPPGCES